MARVEKVVGLRDGNGRVARLARWLAETPASASVDQLFLEHKEEGDWKRIQAWARKAVDANLASVIDSTITELANELAAYVTARVVWFDTEHGQYWTEHALRVQPEDLGGLQQAFSGDATSIAIQNQRHQEKIVGVHLGGFNSAIQALRETNADLRDARRETAAENARLREDLERERERCVELEAANARLTLSLEEAIALAEAAAARCTDDAKTGQVISLIQGALAAGAAGPQQRAG